MDNVLFSSSLSHFFTGDKPHACELCNKKFALACNLRAHMKTHEGKFSSIMDTLNGFNDGQNFECLGR